MKAKIDWFLVMGIPLFIGGLFLAVFLFSKPAIWEVWDLTNKGIVGDALNGMTAPFIGSVGAILIFFSFREQVRANNIQFEALRQQRELDVTFRFYNELKDDLKEIQETYGETVYKQPSMLDAFMNEIFLPTAQQSSYPELYEFIKYLNDQFMFLSSRLIHNVELGEEDSMAIIEKVKRLFGLYFSRYYDVIRSKQWPNQLANNFSSDIKLVYDALRNMDRYYDFLLDKKMKESIEFAKKSKRKKTTM